MKLGILRTDSIRSELVNEFGEYPEMFARLLHKVDPDLEIVPYDVQKHEYPADIDEVDAYLITGSSHSVYDDQIWIHELSEFIKKLNAAKKKTIGICFGHQLVAHVMGGKTEKAAVGWHIGTRKHDLNEKGQNFLGIESFNLIFSHQDQVIEPARGSEVLASTADCPIAICKIGDHLLTIQAHPEFEVEYARQLMGFRKDIYGKPLYEDGIQSLNLPQDNLQVARLMVEFMQR